MRVIFPKVLGRAMQSATTLFCANEQNVAAATSAAPTVIIKRILGFFFVAGSLTFVFQTISGTLTNQDIAELLSTGGVALSAAFVISVAAFPLAASGWSALLRTTTSIQLPFIKIFWLYSRTSIGKYFPGNIFHFVGRQFFGRKIGLPHRAIAVASIGEIFLVLSTCCLTALLIPTFNFTVMHWSFSQWSLKLVFLIAAALPVCLYLGVRSKPKRLKKFQRSDEFTIEKMARGLVRAYPLYVMYLVSNSLAFWVIAACFSGQWTGAGLVATIGVYAAAHLASYVAVGAPGGLGVREAILVLGLSSVLPEGAVALAAICHRILTICTDLFYFAWSFKFPGTKQPNTASTSIGNRTAIDCRDTT